jgi:putative DNA primase/helicase
MSDAGEMLTAALAYAARGWGVFPVWPMREGHCACGRACGRDAGKHPIVAGGFKAATTAGALIREWWQQWRDANIGIATGTVSGLLVLDVDPRHGGDDALGDLECQHGPLPETPRVLTGGSGLHIYLEHPGGHVRSSAGTAGPGLDVRADGSYCVAPPSLHASGLRYRWELSAGPDEVPLALVPAWLVALVTASVPRLRIDGTPLVIGPGQRNDTLMRLGAVLRRYGVAETALAGALIAINRAHCTPPLEEREVQGIAASVARYPAAEGLLTPFHPFHAADSRADEVVARALGVRR